MQDSGCTSCGQSGQYRQVPFAVWPFSHAPSRAWGTGCEGDSACSRCPRPLEPSPTSSSSLHPQEACIFLWPRWSQGFPNVGVSAWHILASERLEWQPAKPAPAVNEGLPGSVEGAGFLGGEAPNAGQPRLRTCTVLTTAPSRPPCKHRLARGCSGAWASDLVAVEVHEHCVSGTGNISAHTRQHFLLTGAASTFHSSTCPVFLCLLLRHGGKPCTAWRVLAW